MRKAEARKIYREKRMGLTGAQRSKMDDLLLIQLQTVELPFLNAVLSYWPIDENHEPNTHLFTEYLKFRNPELKICYPVSDFTDLSMQAAITDIDTPFHKREKNIHEPQSDNFLLPTEIDLVLVPLLAFDTKGYRVGYGKGFYDKYLGSVRENCILAGFSYFEPIGSISDRDDFDVPLSCCVTPQNVYVF